MSPIHELLYRGRELTQINQASNIMIDIWPSKAMEGGNSKDIGYEIHIYDVQKKSTGGYEKKIMRTIKNLKVEEIGSNGGRLSGVELGKQTLVEIFDFDDESILLNIVNGEDMVIYLDSDVQFENVDSLLDFKLNYNFKSKSMYDFIKQTAVVHEAIICDKCENLEYGFGLIGNDGNGGKCVHCKETVIKHDRAKTLIFSLEILSGMLKYYDNYSNNGSSEKIRLVLEIGNLRRDFAKKGGIPDGDRIKSIQDVIKSIDSLMGGVDDGPIVTLKFGEFGYAHDKDITRNVNAFFHTLSIVLLSLSYIEKFDTESFRKVEPVDNHVVNIPKKKSFWNSWFGS